VQIPESLFTSRRTAAVLEEITAELLTDRAKAPQTPLPERDSPARKNEKLLRKNASVPLAALQQGAAIFSTPNTLWLKSQEYSRNRS
jgi:hypothetical protein